MVYLFDTVTIGAVVAVVEELLKNPFIKIPFEKYPRLTQWVLSLGATTWFLNSKGMIDFSVAGLRSVLEFGVYVVTFSFIVYKTILKK